MRFTSLALVSVALLTLNGCDGGPAPQTPASSPPAAQPTLPPGPQPTAGAPAASQLETGACGPYSATDNLLSNGDLEAPSVSGENQTFATGATFTNWKVDLGSVALIKGGFAMANGAQSLALGGTLSQQVTTIPGKKYQLSFCYATTPGASSGGLDIKWEGASAATLALTSASGPPAWKGAKLTLTAATNRATVAINGAGAMVDTIKLTLIP